MLESPLTLEYDGVKDAQYASKSGTQKVPFQFVYVAHLGSYV